MEYFTIVNIDGAQLNIWTEEPPTRAAIHAKMIEIGQLLNRNSIPGEVAPLARPSSQTPLYGKNRDGGPDPVVGHVTVKF